MAQHRLQRINEVLRRELAGAILKLVPPPQGVLQTVNRVRTAPDLRNADVYISLIGGNAKLQEEIFGRIEEARAELQAVIGRRVKMKFTPHLHFVTDHSVEEGTRILQILEHLPPPVDEEPDSTPMNPES